MGSGGDIDRATPPAPEEAATAPEGLGRGRSTTARFAWLCGAVVAVPIVVTAVKAGADGWVPHSDMAVVAIRARDVPTRGTPLVGMGSSITEHVPGVEVSHPGPSLFWALAPFVAVAGPAWGSLLGVAAVRLASVAALGALAVRTGRRAVVAVVMASALVTLASVEDWGGGYASLNPITVALPFLVVIVAAWRLTDGDPWAAPVLAAAATFAVQGHLSYLVVTAVMVLWAVSATVWRARREGGELTSWRGPLLVAAGVAGLLWAPPLYEALIAAGGNLAQMARVPGGGVEARGLAGAGDTLGALLRGVVGGEARPSARVERGVTAGSLIGAAAIAAALVRARRRGDQTSARLVQSGLVAAVGCAAGVALTPAEPLEDLQILWVPVTAAVIVAGAVLALAPERPAPAGRPHLAPAVALSALVLLAVGPAWPGDIRDRGLVDRAAVDAVVAVTDQVVSTTSPGLYGIRAGNSVRPSLVMSGLAVALEERGYSVLVGRGDTHAFGGNRLIEANGSPAAELIVLSEAVPAPAGGRVIARFVEDRGDPDRRDAALDRLAEVMRASPGLELTSEGRRRLRADLIDGFGLSTAAADATLADPARLVRLSPVLVADALRDGFILAPVVPHELAAELVAQIPFAIQVVERPLR